MDVVGFLIGLVVIGGVVGALGRLALPGPDPMSVGQTILVGIAGSFIAGIVFGLLFGEAGPGLFGAVLGATLVVWLVRRSRQKRAGI